MNTTTFPLHGTPCAVCGCPAVDITTVGPVRMVRHPSKEPCPLPAAATSSPRQRVLAALGDGAATAADVTRVALLPRPTVVRQLQALRRERVVRQVPTGANKVRLWQLAPGAARGEAA